MNFIKKHKVGLIITVVILVIIIVLAFFMYDLLFPNGEKDLYGNRLDGIENVEIKDDAKNKLVTEFKEHEEIDNASMNVTGRLINIMLYLKSELEVEKAKEIANKALTYFSTEELAFYDLQVYLVYNKEVEHEDGKEDSEETQEKESQYPLAGYKHKTSEILVWKQAQ